MLKHDAWFILLFFVSVDLGIVDGRYSKLQLERRVPVDESFTEVRERLATLDTLFIDEASMISAHIFEQVKNNLRFQIKDLYNCIL